MQIRNLFFALAVASTASCQSQNASTNVVSAQYDGSCFYPVPDPKFSLQSYLGTWYQVAGTPFGPTAGSRCVTANYALNPNGTVRVLNSAKRGNATSSLVGNAAPADASYGAGGVFKVSFPGTPPASCPGPNYIVQDYAIDWAIVQTQNWSISYVLSRERQPGVAKIDAWIERAVAFGSNAETISRFDQTECD